MGNFTRKIENFTCENCGIKVLGNGYTNHCPKCLFSKHADVNPGDRAQACHGLMRPIFLELAKHGYKLTHQCLKCGAKSFCKTAEEDNVQALVNLSETLAENINF